MAVAVELVMPRLSESMEEGTVVSWLVADGAPVARGQEIAEIETDKATLPYEAPESGVLRILVPEGTTLRLGAPIGLIDDLPAGLVPPRPVGPVDDDPPTETFAVEPAQPTPGAPVAWSPAWGPQTPAAGTPQRPIAPPPLHHPGEIAAASHHEDEGETTEFDAVSLDDAAAEPVTPAAAAAPPVAQAPPAPVVPPTPPVAPAPVVPPTPPVAPDPLETLAPVAGAAPWVEPVAAPPTPAAPASNEPVAEQDVRYAAEDLIAPPTLAPRPPGLQPALSASAPRVVASPVARRLAGEFGIDLSTVTGSGPDGRIVRADIEAAQAQGAARPPLPASAVPAAASEFTPPVDDERAAAPIPEAEPVAEPEPATVVEPEPEPVAEPEPATVVEPEAEPAVEPEPASTVEPEQVPESELAALVGPDPDFDVPAEPGHDPAQVEAIEAEAATEAEAVEVIVEAAQEARAPDADDEGDQSVEEPDAQPIAAEAPAPATVEARILPAAQPGGGKGEPTIVELSRQQQTVARRMAESKATIPDYATTVEVDAAPLLTLRADLLATRPDLAAPSVNDLLVKAVAIALRAFPRLNGGYRDGRLELYPRINVGIATDAGGVLLVPVIHDADALSVGQIAARTAELLAKAADGGLRPPDIASATFTVSNLGMYGVDEFTAVITPGQAAILTAGAIAERPVVRNGVVVAGQTLRLTLTTDHRAVYGLESAQFLGRVRQLIEHPSSLLA